MTYFAYPRYIVKAYYPDKAEEEVCLTYDGATRCANTHNEAGAGVQIVTWHWVESKVDTGWFPARAKVPK